MKISWVIEGTHSGSEITESVDDAAEALTAAVRQAYTPDHTTRTLAHIMLNVVSPLRLEMVNAGRAQVEQGHTWEGQAGEVAVTLSPTP
ncbi:hypothetical protein HXS80_16035 [Streptomyces sp. CB04723]|uniref:hypothetical protein n=1 Tax=Streptomyces TaxID=1883 RepID=UPI0015C488A2|nr:hypothetical protein [Streptomyces sp. CB04723]QLG33036.1 hypothetical protein HXS80_16035 [Streptomyces sp. CB04723]